MYAWLRGALIDITAIHTGVPSEGNGTADIPAGVKYSPGAQRWKFGAQKHGRIGGAAFKAGSNVLVPQDGPDGPFVPGHEEGVTIRLTAENIAMMKKA